MRRSWRTNSTYSGARATFMRTLTLALSRREREQEARQQQALRHRRLGKLCVDVLAISIALRREACPEQNILQMLEAGLTQERIVRPGLLAEIAGQDARTQRWLNIREGRRNKRR